jgi:hypothetical protein
LEPSIVIGDADVNGSESPPVVVVNGSGCVPPVPGRAMAKQDDSGDGALTRDAVYERGVWVRSSPLGSRRGRFRSD